MTRGRPGKVDKGKVLEALKAGRNDTEIAEGQDCQRQYIQSLRRGWEEDGTLPPRAKTRRRFIARPAVDLSLDNTVELIIQAFTALRQLPELQAELDKYKLGYSNALGQLKAYEQGDRKKKDQEMRLKVAQQQGDINLPLRRK